MIDPNSSILIGSASDFDEFLADFETESFANKVKEVTPAEHRATDGRLDTYLNEMRFGYRFLADRLPAGKLRILEVGAGLGLLSIYLQRQGHDVVALEPSAPAFGMFEATRRVIWTIAGGNMPVSLEKGAEQLDPVQDGTFDFIFSINVMEHIDELDRAFGSIANVLKDDGIWISSCPNYVFPYEPHYAVPLIPFAPNLSRRLHANRINADPATWDTLNFITWAKVRKLAKKNSLNVAFEFGTMYASLKRIGYDQEFSKRHKGGIVETVYRYAHRLQILGIMRFIPPALATPMIFKLTRKNENNAAS